MRKSKKSCAHLKIQSDNFDYIEKLYFCVYKKTTLNCFVKRKLLDCELLCLKLDIFLVQILCVFDNEAH